MGDDHRPALTEPLRRPDGRRFVGRRTLEGSRAIAEAIFVSEGGPPPADHLDWLVSDLEDFLARMGPSRFTFVLGIFVLGVLAPLSLGRLTSLSSLSVDERVEALTKIENSPIAFPLLGVKLLLSVLYYEHPEAADRIGFDGKCMKP